MRLDEDDFSVIVTEEESGKSVGHLDFSEIDLDDRHVPNYYKLIYAYLDKAGDDYKRAGVGREA